MQCGIDVLVAEEFRPLRGLKIGLVTNHTGRTRDGKSTIDVLFHAPGVTLAKLFSPEHGIRGEVDAAVPDGKDDATGLPIISLYGKDRKPRAKDLEGLDALVYDIQDIGARFYTYITTLGLVLEAARESGKKVFVLDRPNAIGGLAVSGPVRDQEFASFIAYHRAAGAARDDGRRARPALQHRAKDRGAVSRWSNAAAGDATISTTAPGSSGSTRRPTCAASPRHCFTPASVCWKRPTWRPGRGTDTPFERVGAPLDRASYRSRPRSMPRPFRVFGSFPFYFTPKERQHAGQRCGGVQILVTSWPEFDPLRLGMTLAAQLRAQYPKRLAARGTTPLALRPGYLSADTCRQARSMQSWPAGSMSSRSFKRFGRGTCCIDPASPDSFKNESFATQTVRSTSVKTDAVGACRLKGGSDRGVGWIGSHS